MEIPSEDEGYEDAGEDFEDPTIAPLCILPTPQMAPRSETPADTPEPSNPATPEPAPLSPGPSSPPPQQHEEVYRGPDRQPGYLAVVELATALVGLRKEKALSERRVDELIRLTEALLDIDRARVHYPPRYRDRPTPGRFKAAKPGRTITPGVENMTRCVVGETSGPATWPSTSLLVETVCILLSRIQTSDTRIRGVRCSRWECMLSDYRHIRDLVLGNRRLMAEAYMQLFDLNKTTIGQWFRKTQRQKENVVLATVAKNRAAAGERRPPATVAVVARPAAKATTFRRTLLAKAAAAATMCAELAQAVCEDEEEEAHTMVAVHPAAVARPRTVRQTPQALALHPLAPRQTAPPAAPPSWTTQPLMDRSLAQHIMWMLPGPQCAPPQLHIRKVNRCRHCGQLRRKETGHTRYGPTYFCAQAVGKSVEDWLREMREKDQGGALD